MLTRTLVMALAWFLASGMGLSPLLFAAGNSESPSTILTQAYLQGSMQGQSGAVLDVNGDGLEDLVIGAPYATHKGTDGSLLIYTATRSGGFSVSPSAVIQGNGNLGWSLAPLGLRSFAAGAFRGSGEDVSLSGSVSIYHAEQNSVVRQTLLTGEDALDKFGYALASGDLNGDGSPDLIVGAPFHSPSADQYQRGAVYVYFGPHFYQKPDVKIPATSSNGGIGFSLATGDINGDGIDDLLIQATGKVIGYFGSDSFAPKPPDIIYNSPSPTTDTDFGRSIKVLWNVDGTGCRDVAIGASQATGSNANAIDSGRLYVLEGCPSANSKRVLAKIEGEAVCGHISGRFGYSVLPVGDISGDGVPDLAVSAIHADGQPSCPMTGRVMIFDGSGLSSGTAALLRDFRGTAKDMHLGTFLATVGGGQRLAVGAPTEKANTGAIRLFRLR